MQIHKNRNQPLIIQIPPAHGYGHGEPRALLPLTLHPAACLNLLFKYESEKKTEIYENKIRKKRNLTKTEYPQWAIKYLMISGIEDCARSMGNLFQ